MRTAVSLALSMPFSVLSAEVGISLCTEEGMLNITEIEVRNLSEFCWCSKRCLFSYFRNSLHIRKWVSELEAGFWNYIVLRSCIKFDAEYVTKSISGKKKGNNQDSSTKGIRSNFCFVAFSSTIFYRNMLPIAEVVLKFKFYFLRTSSIK